MRMKRSFGLLAHPTSFPSPYGIGDLGRGAEDFLSFAEKSGAKLWQVLPLGPTSFGDSPYQSFSTFAGNPLLISPDRLADDGLLSKRDILEELAISRERARADYETAQQVEPEPDPADFGLSDMKVNYSAVIHLKDGLFKRAFKRFQAGGFAALQREFAVFCDENAAWLSDYALFAALKTYFIEERRYTFESEAYNAYRLTNMALLTENAAKDNFYGAVWASWPEDIKLKKPAAMAAWAEKLKEETTFISFLQFLFFRQWAQIKALANSLDIAIIGDIPIFVAMDSADVWANTGLFELDEGLNPKRVAGVPPDYFSATGQLWGNPLYDWAAHNAEHYDWWCRRVDAALKLTDMVRIDHFRGFAAYWAVPYGDETAENGEWKKGPGSALFDAMQRETGDLPIIAEDLGLITEDVVALRDQLGFPGMKVLQFGMENPSVDAYLPHNYETSRFVVYTGTHDNDTSAGWYARADEKIRDYFRRYLNVSGEDAAWDFIRLAISSTAAFAVAPIQDVMSLSSECRMNTPGVAGGNWTFRYTDDMLDPVFAGGLRYLNVLYNRAAPKPSEEDDNEDDNIIDSYDTMERFENNAD